MNLFQNKGEVNVNVLTCEIKKQAFTLVLYFHILVNILTFKPHTLKSLETKLSKFIML